MASQNAIHKLDFNAKTLVLSKECLNESSYPIKSSEEREFSRKEKARLAWRTI